ncbi:hypothetical protein Fmac_009892 [Flemingia macrophylla]|uniref:EF-hand domain-containing protein n=1 Tax=Flemingia macrophylla TaxID=520843 RepID=A0ABD1N1I9_9FABA
MATELKEVFKKFNVNGNGKISTSELGSIMGSLGQATSEQKLENIIRKMDDGDGCISLPEFKDGGTTIKMTKDGGNLIRMTKGW